MTAIASRLERGPGVRKRRKAKRSEERLRQLEKLKNEKLITPEEYTAKRAEILKDI